MLFNSLDFALFLPLVFLLYWGLFGSRVGGLIGGRLGAQNIFLVVASYIFYGWWDWRFLSLIVLSTLVDYFVGLGLGRMAGGDPAADRRRKLLLAVSVVVNLGILGFFKYFNFFAESFASVFSLLGRPVDSPALRIILPVGISFYTFQTMSYTIDIYRGKMRPTRDLAAFAAFVAFFPQLVAGPIERASRLLPQMLKQREFSFDQAMKGLRLMLWGFFKKIVIADSLAPAVNEIFANYGEQGSLVLLLGVVLFSFQIYGDFSGYSDIARGVARLLGFELMLNFNFPYLSRSIGEFWRKWHISLTSWFKDYLYIPLGGSRVGRARAIRNVAIVFLVSGLWHGASWTFVAWGAFHALLFIPSFLGGRNRRDLDHLQAGRLGLPGFVDLLKVSGIFLLVSLGWIFFRCESLGDAFGYLAGIFSFRPSPGVFLNPYDMQPMIREFIVLGLFVVAEYLLLTRQIRLYSVRRWPGMLVDAALLILIILHIPLSEQLAFIYFQF